MPGTLPSFGSGLKAVVVGASGGIGGAFVELLAREPGIDRILALSRSEPQTSDPTIRHAVLDLESEASIRQSAEEASELDEAWHLVIVATGLLHGGAEVQPEKTWRSLDGAALAAAFRINAIGPALVAKHFLPLLAKGRKSVFAALSARVGSIEDNRLGGWHAYRASKAALNMTIRTLSVELTRRNPDAICVGLHPGTVDTALSRPFQSGVPSGQLFAPAQAAGHLLAVLDGLSPADSGGLYAWDGERIPF